MGQYVANELCRSIDSPAAYVQASILIKTDKTRDCQRQRSILPTYLYITMTITRLFSSYLTYAVIYWKEIKENEK
jgi:hypothetical protein